MTQPGETEEALEAEMVNDGEPVHAGDVDTNQSHALQIYKAVAIAPFVAEVNTILAKYETADDTNGLADKYDILPTGELYLPHMQYRKVLSEAFGRGGWAIVPMEPFPRQQGNQLVQAWAMMAHGRFIGETTGGAEYQPDNARMIWSDACETVKSNALSRLCKDLSIATDCWDRRYVEKWKAERAIEVWGPKWKKDGGTWRVTAQKFWRRKDAAPIKDEIRPVNGNEAPPRLDKDGHEIGGQPGAEPKREQQPASNAKPHPTPLMDKGRTVGPKTAFTVEGVILRHGLDDKKKGAVKKYPRYKTQSKEDAAAGKPKEQMKASRPPNDLLWRYTVETEHGEWFSTFSTTFAKRCVEAADAKTPLRLSLKLTVTDDMKEFLNLEEILADKDEEE